MVDFLRPAGMNTFKKCGSAKECMAFPDRPSTPPKLEKFRKSRSTAPGVRFQHHGTVDDYQTLNLDHLTFGGRNRDERYETAANLMRGVKLGEVGKINFIKAEAIYKQASREPLGRSLERGTVMPSKFKNGKHKFSTFDIRNQTKSQIDFLNQQLLIRPCSSDSE